MTKHSTGAEDRDEALLRVYNMLTNNYAGYYAPKAKNKITKPALLNKEQFFNTITCTELTLADAQKIITILQRQKLIESAIYTETPQAVAAVQFLSDFWTWETSPYVKEKSRQGNPLHKRHVANNLYCCPHPQKKYHVEKKYGDMTVSEVVRMRELEDENTKLKKLVADTNEMQVFDISALTSGIEGQPELEFEVVEVYPGTHYKDLCIQMLYPQP